MSVSWGSRPDPWRAAETERRARQDRRKLLVTFAFLVAVTLAVAVAL